MRISMNAAALVAHLQKALAGISAVKEAVVELVDGGVVTRGTASLGLSVPFEARWQVSTSATPGEIIVELAQLEARVFGMSSDTMAAGLMKIIAKKIEAISGVRVEGRTVRVMVADMLRQQFGVTLDGVVRGVEVTREGIAMTIESRCGGLTS